MSGDFITTAPSLAAAVSRIFTVYSDLPHSRDRHCRHGHWWTYADIGQEAAHLAAGLASPPLSLTRRSAVVICLPNSPEWLITDFACALNDFVVVGLHVDWSVETITNVLQDAEVVCCVVAATVLPKLRRVLELANGSLHLRSIVVFEQTVGPRKASCEGELTLATQDVAPTLGLDNLCVAVASYFEVVATGQKTRRTITGFGFGSVYAEDDVETGDEHDIYTLLYSSGTSGGPPKASAIPKDVWRKTNCSPGPFASIASPKDRRCVSYLALAHGADRGIAWAATVAGGRIGFIQDPEGSEGFFGELRLVRPTFFLGMSYFWQDRYTEHLHRLHPAIDKVLIEDLGKEVAETIRGNQPELWRDLVEVFRRTRRGQALETSILAQASEQFGDKLLVAATGGARTAEPVLRFMQSCLSQGNESRVLDVYGATEFPGISTNGEIGGDVELKLMEVRCDGKVLYSPESVPPVGEIVVRRKGGGSRVSYWKRPELDLVAWDEDGFYHTGDVGVLDYMDPLPAGTPRLKVIDRVKNLEEVYWEGDSAWIQATDLEDRVYAILPEISSIVLAADRNTEGIIALVVASLDFVRKWCEQRPGSGDIKNLCAQQSQQLRGSEAAADVVPSALESDLLSVLRSAGKNAGLKAYEIPIACVVDLNAWSAEENENGGQPLLTITGKPRRGIVKLTYLEAIGSRYGRLQLASQTAPSGSSGVASAGKVIYVETQYGPKIEVHAQQNDTIKDIKMKISQQEGFSADQQKLVFRGRLVEDSQTLAHCGCDLTSSIVPVFNLVLTQSTDAVKRAMALKAALEVERAGEVHSQQQNQLAKKFNESLSSYKKGSRVVDTSFINDKGETVCRAETARSREWIDGHQAFEFTIVQDIDDKGDLKDHLAIPGPAPSLSSDGAAISIEVTVKPSLETSSASQELRLIENGFANIGRLRHVIAARLGVPLRAIRLANSTSSIELDNDSQRISDIGSSSICVTAEIVESSATYKLAPHQLEQLNDALGEIKAVAKHLRANDERWAQELSTKRKAAEDAVQGAVEALNADVASAMQSFLNVWSRELAAATPALRAFLGEVDDGQPLLVETRKVIAALVRGKRTILSRHEMVGCVDIEERAEAYQNLETVIMKLRKLGDDLDVDTRSLPVTWTMDLDWAVKPRERPTCECIMPGCGLTVYADELMEHTCNFTKCDPSIGVAEETGTSMGGNQSIFCEVSHVQIDPEDKQLFPPEGGELPARRGIRYHSVDSGIDRRPDLHELLEFLHAALQQGIDAGANGAKVAKVLLESYDTRHNELWVRDKQHIYWLHRHVRAGKDLGKLDTPASMILRACDAFAARLCLGLPGQTLVPDAELPRKTPRGAVVDAAGIVLHERDGFHWLTYADMHVLVRRIAAGFLALVPAQSLVAIVGYNDFEWVLADFAAAVAGMATVGIHTTYACEAAASVIATTCPAVLCASLDMLGPPGSRNIYDGGSESESRSLKIRRWEVASLLRDCSESVSSLRAVIATDASAEVAQKTLRIERPSFVSSFLEMVLPSTRREGDLPDPFEARGMPYTMLDGSVESCALLLMTSGSSGKPKAVVVGANAFVNDIAGDSSEAKSFSEGITISYIPLSHSSDRYKVWQHFIYGGRVALCYYAASNWEAHETEKKDHLLEYTSPIDGLFNQVVALRPTNMACPPNIWAGLHEKYKECLAKGHDSTAALTTVAALFGDRIKGLATGGSPTTEVVLEFATKLCRIMDAAFVNSYGTTEAGAITSDGRQIGQKFKDIKMRLIDRPEIGFTHTDCPHPRGEVAVASPSLCLGYLKGNASTHEVFLEVDPPTKPCPDWVQPPLPQGRWYLTRDLASLDATGKLTLIDRVGAVVSTRGGHVISLGELETSLERLHSVRYCICHASPEYDDIVAIVVLQKLPLAERDSQASPVNGTPHLRALAATAEKLGLIAEADAWNHVRKHVGTMDLQFGEAVDDWTVARGLITGTMKKQRGELLRAYELSIAALHRR